MPEIEFIEVDKLEFNKNRSCIEIGRDRKTARRNKV